MSVGEGFMVAFEHLLGIVLRRDFVQVSASKEESGIGKKKD